MKPSHLNMTKAQKDIQHWPEVFESNLSPQVKAIFLKRKQSVNAWFQGKQVKFICQEFQCSRSQLYRWIERCISLHQDGRILGWRGLIPFKNTKKYMSTVDLKGTLGHPGSLTKFFLDHPEIYNTLLDNYFSKKIGDEKYRRINNLHKKFIKLCQQKGIEEDEYPLNTASVSKTAFYSLFKQLSEKYYSEYLASHETEETIRAQYFSQPSEFYVPNIRPYERIELDGHKIDLRMNVTIQQVDGSFLTKELERIWVIACIEKASRAILGYHLAYTREYSAADVLLAIKNSVYPWSPKELSLPFGYSLGAGFPSGLIEKLQWAVFDEISLDNAKAHLSKIVVENLTENLNCAFNDGPAATPEVRGVIERFFGVLEEKGMHRLPGTTGSNPRDKRRDKNAEVVVSIEELEDLLEILIANYNATPHSSINKVSPLQYLNDYFENNPHIIRYLPEHLRESNSISSFSVERSIRGNKKEGKRPYIQYEKAIYKNISLSNSFSLIGQKLTLIVNICDLRAIKAFLPNGQELGVLTVQGKWSLSAHDFKMRKSINQLISSRELSLAQEDDPVTCYIEYLASKSQKSKRAANLYLKAIKHVSSKDAPINYERNVAESIGTSNNISKKKQKSRHIKINRTMDY